MSFFRDHGRLRDRLKSGNGAEILQELQDEIGRDRDMFFEPNQEFGFSPRMQRPSFHEMFNSSPRPFHRMDPAYDNLHPSFGGTRTPGRRDRRERQSSGSSGFSEEDDSGRASGETSSQGSGGAEHSGVERTIPIQIMRDYPEKEKKPHIPAHVRCETNGPQHSVSASEVEARMPKLEEDMRQTRASSAPPDGRPDPGAPGKFVSKVKIANEEGGMDPQRGYPQHYHHQYPPQHGGGMTPPHQNVNQSNSPRPQRSSQVRHIPIIIEGRDETDHVRRPTPQSSPRFPQRVSRDASPIPMPQPESSPRCYSPRPQPEAFARPHSPRMQTEASPRPQSPHPARDASPRPQTPQNHYQQDAKPEEPKKDVAMAKLEGIQNEVNELRKSVESFSGPKGCKDFLYLDEMLTRTLLKLDDIETGGRDEIRQKRKAIVSDINANIEILEKRASSHSEEAQQNTQENNVPGSPTANNPGETQKEGKAPSPPPREKRMKSELMIKLEDPKEIA